MHLAVSGHGETAAGCDDGWWRAAARAGARRSARATPARPGPNCLLIRRVITARRPLTKRAARRGFARRAAAAHGGDVVVESRYPA